MTALAIILSLLLGHSIASNGAKRRLLKESRELNKQMYEACFKEPLPEIDKKDHI